MNKRVLNWYVSWGIFVRAQKGGPHSLAMMIEGNDIYVGLQTSFKINAFSVQDKNKYPM